MLFGEAYGETLIGSTYRYVFVVLIIVLLCSYLFISGGVQIKPLDKFPFNCAVSSWCLLLISVPFWSYYHNIYSYGGIVVAFIVYLLDFKFVYKLIVGFVFLSLGLTAYEFVTHKLLFVNVLNGVVFDEALFGGNLGVFRAKGLFWGPTVLGMFMITAFILANKNLWLLFSAILSCFLRMLD